MSRTALIVDDQAFLRVLMRQLLEDCGFIVIGEAEDVTGALTAAAELEPDLMLLDVQLPDGTGTEVARTVSAWPIRPRIVLVSTVDYSAVAQSCGADGFILKGDLTRESLLAAVDQ